MGHITLGAKRAGERSAGNLHAPFDEAGAGDGLTVELVRHSQRKRGATDRLHLRSTAPAPDPTDERGVETEYGAASEAPATERAGNSWASPTPPRHTSTLHAARAPRDNRAGEVRHRLIVVRLLLPSDQETAKAVDPRVAALDHPAASTSMRIRSEVSSLFAA